MPKNLEGEKKFYPDPEMLKSKQNFDQKSFGWAQTIILSEIWRFSEPTHDKITCISSHFHKYRNHLNII